MPELPEVEIVRKTLFPLLVGHKIIGMRIFMNKIIKEPDIITFQKKIIGQTINDLQRIAKQLIFVLDDHVLLSHLRMEGKYYYQKKDEPINWKHILIVFELDNGYELRYHDTRRFGTFHLQAKETYKTQKPYTNIGPEPFNNQVSAQYLQEKWKMKKQAIKTSLLDQTVISGLGNIYVDEVLFKAKIHPESITKNLNLQQLNSIIEHAIKILNLSITLGGTTIATYTSSLGITGTYQKNLQVHTRVNKLCFICNTKIKKIKVNGRGTYFCEKCQIKY